MKALDRKVIRDLLRMKGQAVAICLVIASGVATFVMSLSVLHSLEGTLETYYERYGFPDVFAHLKRAPRAIAERVAEIPGVARVQARVVENVTLHMPDLPEPARGRLVGIDASDTSGLNRLYLRSGSMLAPGSRRQALVSEAFAAAHDLAPGDTVDAVLNGRWERISIVGIAFSPEYIYQIREGEVLPDARRFGIFWMDAEELSAAFDVEGAFNDLAVQLEPHASEQEVIRRIDELAEPYGSLGAYGREDHVSHEFVSNEIRELRSMTVIIPTIFLGVAAFLLNVVLTRLVSTQREQIAVLKALGYARQSVALHFLKLAMVIVVAGLILGSAVGAWMGASLTEMYTEFFALPLLIYELKPEVVPLALVVSGGAGLAGTVAAVLHAARLPAAEAMRPQPPASYRPTVLERAGLSRWLSPAARMVLRQLERRPMRALLSCLTIATATSILVVGEYVDDSIQFILEHEFQVVQRHDMIVTFNEARSHDALVEVAHLPGVLRAEPFRMLPVRLRSGHRSRRVGIFGLLPGATLYQPLDGEGRLVPLPEEGLVVSEKLAEVLGVAPGDSLTVEVLEDARPVFRAPVEGLVTDYTGVAAYARFDTANRYLDQDGVLNGAYLACDPARIDVLYAALRQIPGVAGVRVRSALLESFRETIARNLLLMKTVNVIFAVIIAIGVVYNSARISLSERNRELATLRVIGFSRHEISTIQLGELAVLTVAGIVPGLVLGHGLAALSSSFFDSELFRIPLVIHRSTYAFAAAVVLAAAIGSGLIVRRMLGRLDLVAVLKSRE